VAETDLLTSDPVDPERLVMLIGKVSILERLTAGVLVPLELLQAFFGPSDPDAHPDEFAPGPPITREQFSESLHRVLDSLSERLGTKVDAAQAVGPGA
jgi:hypothetical protein